MSSPRGGRRIGYLVSCKHASKACGKCLRRRELERKRLRFWRGSPLSAGYVPPRMQQAIDARDAARYRYLRDKLSRAKAARLLLRDSVTPLDRTIDNERRRSASPQEAKP